jgi:SPP1 family predicted phage head-tail adaptor
MRIGKLDRRITIQRATETADDFGERIVAWNDEFTCWAALEIKRTGSTEKIVDGYETSVQRVDFSIRQSSDSDTLTTADRISYDSKIYDIVAIHELGRGVDVRLICEHVE